MMEAYSWPFDAPVAEIKDGTVYLNGEKLCTVLWYKLKQESKAMTELTVKLLVATPEDLAWQRHLVEAGETINPVEFADRLTSKVPEQ